MRVQTRPQVQVSHSVAELDTVDLEAIRLVRDWGLDNHRDLKRGWTFSPCPRPDCGGAIVSGWTDACILCARNGNAPIAPGRPRRHDYGPRNASGSL